MDIKKAIEKFTEIMEKAKNDHLKGFVPETYQLQKYTTDIKWGKRFAKITATTAGQTSVAAFVDMTTGDIYKPASWRAPAKKARGNVFSDQNGAEALDQYGNVRYLR